MVDRDPLPLSTLKKKGNKGGDSFHLGILTVLATRSELEGSCVIFTFCMFLLRSYGFYRSTSTRANGCEGLCQDYVVSLWTELQALSQRLRAEGRGSNV